MKSFNASRTPLLSLALWVAVYLTVAGFIGNMTRSEIPSWYRGLEKPPFNPPDFVFGIVWTILYIIIAVVGWRLWNARTSNNKLPLMLFIVQTIMNWAWSYLFFDFHFLGISFLWIAGLVLAVITLILALRESDRVSSLLLLPYLLWISFATYLNAMIWHLN